MFRSLIFFYSIFNQINGDCLYPQWKSTCQKYCMENQFYEIQLNQCYSQDPNQLTCKCSGQILTEKIKDLIKMNNSKSISSSTILSMINETDTSICVPSESCLTGKFSCYGLNEYCKCENGSWMNIPCLQGNTCQSENPFKSCQTSVDRQRLSLGSSSSAATSLMIINEYHILFLFISLQNIIC